MSIVMQRCTNCAATVFPPRSLCPHCHSNAFQTVSARRGVIEETSLQRGTPPIMLASVRTDLGPIVIAKILGENGVPGAEIELASSETNRAGGLVAVVPQPSSEE